MIRIDHISKSSLACTQLDTRYGSIIADALYNGIGAGYLTPVIKAWDRHKPWIRIFCDTGYIVILKEDKADAASCTGTVKVDQPVLKNSL